MFQEPLGLARIGRDINTEEVAGEARRIVAQCRSGDRGECYKKEFALLTREEGFRFAEETLYALQDIDTTQRHCHVLGHEIAKVAIRQQPNVWEEMIGEVNLNVCGGAFMHGILEARVGDDPTFELSAATIEEICTEHLPKEQVGACAHISGHILLVEKEGDLRRAFPACEGLRNREHQYQCLTGVFMEDSFKFLLAEHGLGEVPIRDAARFHRQRERCFQYRGVRAEACWTDLAEVIGEFHGYDQAKTYQDCYQAPEARSRERCYVKAAMLMAISIFPQSDRQDYLAKICVPYRGKGILYRECFVSATSALLHYSPKFTARAIKICSALDETYQEACFRQVGTHLKLNVSTVAERTVFCQGTPEQFKALCVGEPPNAL